MSRVTTTLAAVLSLFLPLGRPLLAGLTIVVEIGSLLLSTQAAYAQSADTWFDSGLATEIINGRYVSFRG